MKQILIGMLKNTVYDDLCTYVGLDCTGTKCEECPFYSEENKQKLVDELEAGQ